MLRYAVLASSAAVAGCTTVTVSDRKADREYELKSDGELAFVRKVETEVENSETGQIDTVSVSSVRHHNFSAPNLVHTTHFARNPEQKALTAANALCKLPKGTPAEQTQLRHAFNYFGQNYFEFTCPEPGKDTQ